MNGSGSEVIDLNSISSLKSVISQSWDVFANQSIKSLELLGPKKLLVLSGSQMSVIEVDNCEKFRSCFKCLSIRDPHCGWDNVSQKCMAKYPEVPHKERDQQFMQDVVGGDTNLCPAGTLIDIFIASIFKERCNNFGIL